MNFPTEKVLPNYKELKEGLFKYMVANEVGISTLAREIGIEWRTLSGFLNGQRSPRFGTLVRMTVFLGDEVTYEDFKAKA